jgi:hypothetical protein
MTVYHDDNFNYFYENGRLLVGNGTMVFQNGAFNKSLINAVLPSSFDGVPIYGTYYRCLGGMPNLVSIFIPRTYKEIGADFFYDSYNVTSVVFEDNSQLRKIDAWIAIHSNIVTFTFPASLKIMYLNQSFLECSKLKTIYYQGMLQTEFYSDTFLNVPDDLKIYVRRDYPYETFAGRSVTKVLNAVPRITHKYKNSGISLCTINILYLIVPS